MISATFSNRSARFSASSFVSGRNLLRSIFGILSSHSMAHSPMRAGPKSAERMIENALTVHQGPAVADTRSITQRATKSAIGNMAAPIKNAT